MESPLPLRWTVLTALEKEHSVLRRARKRGRASRQELKARSMQVAYRTASNRTASLSLDEARDLIAHPLICLYCWEPIYWKQLSIDHRIPRSRGGTSKEENLVWVHLDCNLIKGSLRPEEFKRLWDFLSDNPELKKDLLTRLKAGGGFMYRRRKC